MLFWLRQWQFHSFFYGTFLGKDILFFLRKYLACKSYSAANSTYLINVSNFDHLPRFIMIGNDVDGTLFKIGGYPLNLVNVTYNLIYGGKIDTIY